MVRLVHCKQLQLTSVSITRVSLTVVPNISVLRIARWGVREFAIAIVAVNTVSLRPRKYHL
jgi:hypothetical protein